LPVTFDTCEMIEERWTNWLRQDPVVAIETPGGRPPQAEGALHRLREKEQFNSLYGARRFVRRLNELGVAHRYESLPFLAQALSG
jgi:hypothetical protein